MKLEDIGFYTLSDYRASQASVNSPLWRCELLVTNACNFNCPYCRHVGPEGHMSWDEAQRVFDLWCDDGLKNVRLSGGEPTLWPLLAMAVSYLRARGVERIAISTNGSAPQDLYGMLIDAGANDFSVSFDACCADDCSKMTGGNDAWNAITSNIKYIASRTYVTAGVVLTEDNQDSVVEIVGAARECGVQDIRVIPAAQHAKVLDELPDVLAMPILEYRKRNLAEGVRGLRESDCRRCRLVLDDMAVIGTNHYPCIIYAREGGQPIGGVGENMRAERLAWSLQHDCHADPICSGNCLDVCRDYNNTAHRYATQCKEGQ